MEVLRTMAKSLIYMGRVGDKYRVALFDSDNPLARRLPVKDVPMLPTNVEYLELLRHRWASSSQLGRS